MRTDWAVTTLGEVCLIKPPKKEAKEKLSDSDTVSFVPMNKLGICSKDIDRGEDRALRDVIGNYTYFAEEDVLLAKITPCFENGKLGIAKNLNNGIGFGSSEFIVFRSKGMITPEYLFYFLSQKSFRESGAQVMTGAVGHKRVPKEYIEDHPIPLPPLPVQKRIVAILDETFAGIAAAVANTEKNLANTRELFENYLNAVFTQKGDGWVQVRIEDVCESIVDCVNKTAPKVDAETPFKMIRTTNVRNGLVSLESVNYVTEDVYRIWTRRQVPQRGDVILTREAPMGEVGMLLSDEKIFLGQRLVSYRANNAKLNNRFLLYALQSSELQGQIHALASGSTVQHMRVPDSKNLQLPLPNLSVQEATVATLDSLREKTQSLETTYLQKLGSLAELKQSILQKAFAGELTSLPEKTSQESVA